MVTFERSELAAVIKKELELRSAGFKYRKREMEVG